MAEASHGGFREGLYLVFNDVCRLFFAFATNDVSTGGRYIFIDNEFGQCNCIFRVKNALELLKYRYIYDFHKTY